MVYQNGLLEYFINQIIYALDKNVPKFPQHSHNLSQDGTLGLKISMIL